MPLAGQRHHDDRDLGRREGLAKPLPELLRL